ncbi:MAG TPA: hypothetical protein VK211_22845 [Kamptonema sp.]|nr:hypothetical protein [Kamptonema sp.]
MVFFSWHRGKVTLGKIVAIACYRRNGTVSPAFLFNVKPYLGVGANDPPNPLKKLG